MVGYGLEVLMTRERVERLFDQHQQRYYQGEISLKRFLRNLHLIERIDFRLFKREHPISLLKVLVGLFLPLLFMDDPFGIRRTRPRLE